MEDDLDNPLDDELLRELGLEPTPKPGARKPEKSAAAEATLSPTSSAKREKPPSPPPSPTPPLPPTARPPSTPSAQIPSQEKGEFDRGLAHLSQEMPVQVVAVIGKKTLTLRELVSFKQGEVLELGKLPNESVDLVANGKLIARGEMVLIDGKVGIQIKQLVG